MTTPGQPAGSAQRPAVLFADATQWRRWLELNHATSTGMWMALAKRHVSPRGLTWADAVAEALCFGWIDSQVQRVDEDFVRQRWTPRRPGSTWSNVNIDLVAQLQDAGRMTPAGLAAFAARSPARSGIYAYEGAVSDQLPPDLTAALAADERASAWWQRSTPSYRRICINWVTSAKRDATRQSRMAQLVADSAAGRLIPSQRYGQEPAWARHARAELGIGPFNDCG